SDNDYDRLPRVAQELVALGPEVIFANTTPATKALQKETRTTPIVFVQVSDPTGAGVVASLARPGGNTTGFLLYEDSIAGKWLGMLKEIEPHLTRAALLGNPRGFPFGYFLRIAKAITPSLGIEIVPAPIANIEDLDRSISSFARVSNGGLLAPPDNTVEEHRDLVIALAARHRLPAVYATREFVVAGGSCLTARTSSSIFAKRHPMLTVCCAALIQPIFPSRRRQSTKRFSTSRPRRLLVSRCRQRCWYARTRLSNDPKARLHHAARRRARSKRSECGASACC